MSILVIEDLEKDKALDEGAMKAISGGSAGLPRLAGGMATTMQANLRETALVESTIIRGFYKLNTDET